MIGLQAPSEKFVDPRTGCAQAGRQLRQEVFEYVISQFPMVRQKFEQRPAFDRDDSGIASGKNGRRMGLLVEQGKFPKHAAGPEIGHPGLKLAATLQFDRAFYPHAAALHDIQMT